MFYSWACLSRLGGRRSRQFSGLRGRRARVGHSVASVGQPGPAGRGARAVLAACRPARRPPPQPVLQAARLTVFTLLSVSVFTGRPALPVAAALHDPGFGLAKALFFLGTLGLWKGPQNWSPRAGFGSISVADSLGPWTLGLSFPICNMTGLTV